MPTPPFVLIGCWERDSFIGVIIFSRGNASNPNKQFGLPNTQIAELTRIALRVHSTPTSRLVSIAIRMLRKHCSGLRLLVSYADMDQGHLGVVYQASNWLYAGWAKGADRYRDALGRMWHTRMLSPTGYKKCYGKRRHVLRPQDLQRVKTQGRHKYLYPLDPTMRCQIEGLRKPYPHCARSETSDTPANHAGEGGAAPTLALSAGEPDGQEGRP